MISKWQWIENKLKKLKINHADFPNLCTKASEIEKILINIYGNTITEQFKSNFYKIENEYNNQNKVLDKLRYIDSISGCRHYCIACTRCEYRCNKCEFAKIAGKCCDNDSLYGNFSYLLSHIIPQILKRR